MAQPMNAPGADKAKPRTSSRVSRALKSGVVYGGSAVLTAVSNITPHIAGAVDILVVEQPDGSRKASPFYVRFGKYTALRTGERNVKLFVNGQPAPFGMHIGAYGQVYFAEGTSEAAEADDEEQEALLEGMMSPASGYSSGVEAEAGEAGEGPLTAVSLPISGVEGAGPARSRDVTTGAGRQEPAPVNSISRGVPVPALGSGSLKHMGQLAASAGALANGGPSVGEIAQALQGQLTPGLSANDRNESFLSARETLAGPLGDEVVSAALAAGASPALLASPERSLRPHHHRRSLEQMAPSGGFRVAGGSGVSLLADSEGASRCGWSEDEEGEAQGDGRHGGAGASPQSCMSAEAGASLVTRGSSGSVPWGACAPGARPQPPGFPDAVSPIVGHQLGSVELPVAESSPVPTAPGTQTTQTLLLPPAQALGSSQPHAVLAPLHQQVGFPENGPTYGAQEGLSPWGIDAETAGPDPRQPTAALQPALPRMAASVDWAQVLNTGAAVGQDSDIQAGATGAAQTPALPIAAAAGRGAGSMGRHRASPMAGGLAAAVAADGPTHGSGSHHAISLLSSSLKHSSCLGNGSGGGGALGIEALRAATIPEVELAEAGGGPFAAGAAAAAAQDACAPCRDGPRCVALSIRAAPNGGLWARIHVLPHGQPALPGPDAGPSAAASLRPFDAHASCASEGGYLGDAEPSTFSAAVVAGRQHQQPSGQPIVNHHANHINHLNHPIALSVGHHEIHHAHFPHHLHPHHSHHHPHHHLHGHHHHHDELLHSTSAPLPSSAIDAAAAAAAAAAASGRSSAIGVAAPPATTAAASAAVSPASRQLPAPGLQLSLCGGRLTAQTPYATACAIFEAGRLSEEAFMTHGSALLASPELVVRLSNGVIYPWHVLSHALVAQLAFGTWRVPPGGLCWAPEGAAGAAQDGAGAAALLASAMRAAGGATEAGAARDGAGAGGESDALAGPGSSSVTTTPVRAGNGMGSWLWPFGSRRDRSSITGGSGGTGSGGAGVAGRTASGRSPPPPPSSPHVERQASVDKRVKGGTAGAANGAATQAPLPRRQSSGPQPEAGADGAAGGAAAGNSNGSGSNGGPRDGGGSGFTVTKKSLTPTAEQLAALDLKRGQNVITYRIGGSELKAYVYYLHWRTKIVISDIDGTITRSDVLGHLLPAMGLDWSHPGIAELLSNISSNNYQVMYLSSRSISQANITRDFINTLVQGHHRMPLGPVIISPHGLLPSLYREMILRRPHEFKIETLMDIRALFPGDWNPFFGGFGNRDTDEISYREVGVLPTRIFIINPRGELRQSVCREEASEDSSSSSSSGEAGQEADVEAPAPGPGPASILDPPPGPPRPSASAASAGGGTSPSDAAAASATGVSSGGAARALPPPPPVRSSSASLRRAAAAASAAADTPSLSSLSAINQLVHDIFPPLWDVGFASSPSSFDSVDTEATAQSAAAAMPRDEAEAEAAGDAPRSNDGGISGGSSGGKLRGYAGGDGSSAGASGRGSASGISVDGGEASPPPPPRRGLVIGDTSMCGPAGGTAEGASTVAATPHHPRSPRCAGAGGAAKGMQGLGAALEGTQGEGGGSGPDDELGISAGGSRGGGGCGAAASRAPSCGVEPRPKREAGSEVDAALKGSPATTVSQLA